jgi:precorrin-2 dehydrogenase / sirohydrochlorin ferrochelatase
VTTTRQSLLGYPVNLIVAGRRCVVVGAGRIAARKIDALLAADAEVHVVAPGLGDQVRAWRDEQRITVDERRFEPSDLDDAWLATAATDDAAVNNAVFEAGAERRVWVNSADDPDNCSFTLMSVIRRGDVVVTVGTGGRSPALAAWLKEHLSEELGPEYETLLELLSEAREALRADGRSTEDADWKRALDSGMLELVRAGRVTDAKELLRSCLSSSLA